MHKQRPRVTLTYAQSIDGAIAARRGEPLALSGSQSMRMTHTLRATHDAILVGVGTVLADNPSLTTRLVAGPSPQPIVLDSSLRTPVDAKLLRNGVWIVTTAVAEARVQALQNAGARVVRLPQSSSGGVSLPALLDWLGEAGIRTLMVEGGAAVIDSFLQAGLVDRVVITIAPLLLGGLKPVSTLLSDGRLRNTTIEQLGDDVVIRGEL